MLTRPPMRTVDLGGHPALAGVDLDVAAGTVVAVLGPSGSGKSTLLRAIAGLQRLDRGTVELDGALARRRAATPARHRAHVPGRRAVPSPGRGRERRLRPADAGRAAEQSSRLGSPELLALVGLAGQEHRSIGSLSGGERKRVALARALAPAPRVLLLDEPLGALDRPLHDRLVTELGDLFRTIGQTAVYVTHDVAEAFALGDRVAVMREGRVVQIAAPEELWATPGDAWVARFIGLANVEERGVDGRGHAAGGCRLPAPIPRARRSSCRASATGRS